jgi:hypothetical protein
MSYQCNSYRGVEIWVGGWCDNLEEVGVFVDVLIEGGTWRKSKFYLR